MVRFSRSAAVDGIHPDPSTGLEGSMGRLGLGSNSSEDWVYPERPGEQDCSFFIRNGCCAFGGRCRYNHPRDRCVESNAAKLGGSEYPERVGQPVCEFFLKTGKCRFGPLCKYHHPKHGVGSVLLNNSGYPLRQGERECSYYVKTGQCKFGSACKFDHPQPISPSIQSPPPATYPMVQPPFVPPSQPYPSLPSWQVGNPSISPTSCMPGFYGPILVSPSIVPVPGWSPYEQPVSPVVYPCGQQMVQAGLSYPVHYQSSPTSAYPGPYLPISSSTRPSSVHQKVPEGQGKTVCQYYMKTGICKFGNMCKYHHPPTMRSSYANGNTSPVSIHLHQVSIFTDS
ncbi:zinc finger CCCH domain-containing protein 6-like isoform X2 [Asparagus officinalis]|uniref:zinc finger CCCH domain-containing protein 6-like isoform X2 n=1 Tax=Asparagus officinalis TaxID=4686 RepID=UPI00098E14A2|nr:zinc finger CCCH domain-containing protein 6-like isoform X2 [Asparagus officinalis]